LFKYRIEEELAGRLPLPLAPTVLSLPLSPEQTWVGRRRRRLRTPDELKWKALEVARDKIWDSRRILDPYCLLVRYASQVFPRREIIERLGSSRDPDQVAAVVGEILERAEQLGSRDRLREWAWLLPFGGMAGRAFTADLLVRIPDLVQPVISGATRDPGGGVAGSGFVCDILACAIDLAAAQPEAQVFPGLIDAATRLARMLPSAQARHRVLATLAWPCLRRLHQLGEFQAAENFLQATQALWPNLRDYLPARRPGQTVDKLAAALRALVAKAALRGSVGDTEQATKGLNQALAYVTDGNSLRVEQAELVGWLISDAVATVAITAPDDVFAWTEFLFPRLTPIQSTRLQGGSLASPGLRVIESVILELPGVRRPWGRLQRRR
jgi:hypothetical protein